MKRAQKAKKIIRKIAKSLEKAEFTESMVVIGSLCTSHFDKYSDIDTVITTNKEISSKEVLPLISNFKYKQITLDEKFPYRIDIEIEDIEIMLFFLLNRWIVSDFLDKYNKLKEHEIDKQANFIRWKRAIILFDKKKQIKKNTKKIVELPKKMKEFIIHERLHKLNYYLFLSDGAINIERKRKNYLEVQNLLADIVKMMYEIVYALNNRIVIERKWAPKESTKFKKKPKNFPNKLIKIGKLGNTSKEINKKINLLRNETKEINVLAKKEGIKDLPELKLK